jgi:hypothetical protein
MSQTPQEKWRELMMTRLPDFVSEFRRQGIEEGLALGRASDILRILARRGIAVDDASTERIIWCTDLDTLGAWLDRSLTAAQVTDLFA